VDAVPRFWPSLRARWPASGQRPRWAQAFIGEMLLWLISLTLLVFAVTFNLTLLYGGIAASFVVSLGLRSLAKKRAVETA